MASGRLLLHSFTSLIDQAWLSALNLGLGILLIRTASKDVYGVYAQLLVAGLFVASIMESVIANPLTTLAARAKGAQCDVLISHLSRFQRRLSAWLSLGLGLGVALLADWLGIDTPVALGLSFGIYVYTNALREYVRSVEFIKGRPRQVLHTDLLYGGVVIVGMTAMLVLDAVALPSIFGVFAGASLIALHARGRECVAAADPAGYREAVSQAWRRGRFGLPGALSSWVINYSYLYLAALWAGAAAAAELSASRLLLMPISLTVVAWARVARPYISKLMAAQDEQALRRTTLASVVGLLVIAVVYVAVLWACLPWLQVHLLGPAYQDVRELVLPWGVYFALYAVHLVGAAVLLSADRYPMLLTASLSSLALMLGCTWFAIPAYGVAGAVFSLVAVELFNIALIWLVFFPVIRASRRRY